MTNSNKKTILIVDDQPEGINILNELLADYICLAAGNGKAGVEIAAETKPDLILLDINMPVMDGFEAAKILKANPETEHIPIIFLTANTGVDSFVEGFELGAEDYIMKPYDSAVVLSVVKRKLE